MVFREVSVIEIREVLRAWLAGKGLRKVGGQAGVDRKTARNYVNAALAAGLVRDGGEEQLTDELVGQVVAAVRPARPQGHGAGWEALEGQHAQIVEWVGKDLTVEPVQVDVAEQGGCNPALWGSGDRPTDLPLLHHPRAQHRTQQLQERLVADTFLDRLYQLLDRNRRKTVGDVRLHHPLTPPPGLIDERLQRVMGTAPGTEPERARKEIRLEYRLRHQFPRGLHDPVAHRRDRQRPLLHRAGLGDEHPTRRERTIAAFLQFHGQFVEEAGNPVLLDLLQGDSVDTWRAVVAAHRDPPAPQDVPARDLVHQRVEPPPGIGLGRPVERMLQGTDRIRGRTSPVGGTSHLGTHRAPPPHLYASTK